MTMLALVVVAHPSPTSFSHAMAAAARSVLDEHGFQVASHDLYAEGFDPVQPTGELPNTTSTDVRCAACTTWCGACSGPCPAAARRIAAIGWPR